MKAQQWFGRLGLLVCILMVVGQARADFTASLVDKTGAPHEVTVAPGSFFDVFVVVDGAPAALTWGQLQVIASANNVFRLTEVEFDGTNWDDSGATVPSLPTTLDNLSGEIETSSVDPLYGTWEPEFVRLRFDVISGAGGSFSLNLYDPSFRDVEYSYPYAEVGEDYQVTVAIPAPNAGLLGLLGLGLAAVVARQL